MGRIDEDMSFTGAASFANITLPNNCVTSAKIPASAGIEASKLQHQRKLHYGKAGTAASETYPIFEAEGAATIKRITAGSIGIAGGSATVTIDLKKNGTTVLSGVITLNSGNLARISAAGTISFPTLVDGDLLELVIVATASGGTIPTGLWVSLHIDEAYVA